MFYIGVSVSILILSTVDGPVSLHTLEPCDFFIPFIFYLSVFRPFMETMPAVLCIGLLTDALSAAPFGLYTSIYLWFFIIVKWGLTILHVRSRMFMPLVISLGILFEELIFMACLKISGNINFPASVYKSLAGHILRSAVTGPFIFMAMAVLHKKWLGRIRKLSPEKKQ